MEKLYESLVHSLLGNNGRLDEFTTLWFRTEFAEREETEDGSLINPERIYYQFMAGCLRLEADLSLDSDGIYLFNNKFFFFSTKELSPSVIDKRKLLMKNRNSIFQVRDYTHAFMTLRKTKPKLISKHISLLIRINIIRSFLNYVIARNAKVEQEKAQSLLLKKKKKKRKKNKISEDTIQKKYGFYYKWSNESLAFQLNKLYHDIDNNKISLGIYSGGRKLLANLMLYFYNLVIETIRNSIKFIDKEFYD